jgi:hypothetical protein
MNVAISQNQEDEVLLIVLVDLRLLSLGNCLVDYISEKCGSSKLDTVHRVLVGRHHTVDSMHFFLGWIKRHWEAVRYLSTHLRAKSIHWYHLITVVVQ